MINPNAIQAANAYIASQAKQVEKAPWHFKAKTTRPFVTISRETGAGGTTTGEKIVEYLNYKDTSLENQWALFDKNLIDKVIEDQNLPSEFRHFLSEERISELQSVFETLMGLHPGIKKLAKKTCNTILHLASMGNVVIVGRGANIITKNLSAGLHIRLIAEHEYKIKNIQERFGIGRKEAEKFITDEDIRRKDYVKKLFNKNVADPLMYDLVVKTSSMSTDEIADLVGNRMISLKYHQNSMAEAN